MNYKDYNDYELIYMIREDNEIEYDCLFKKYEPLIRNIASKYVLFVRNNGGDLDDLIQEGFVSLHNAVKYYDENKGNLFYTLANTCIDRGIRNYCKGLTTKKNMIFNKSVSMEKLDNVVGDYVVDPATLVIDIDSENYFVSCKNSFPLKISIVFELKYNGFSYKEIARLLDISISTVNRRLCKIKSKLEDLVEVM